MSDLCKTNLKLLQFRKKPEEHRRGQNVPQFGLGCVSVEFCRGKTGDSDLHRGDFAQMRNDIQAKLFFKRVVYPGIGILFSISSISSILNSFSTLLFYVCSTTLYAKPLLLDSDIYLSILPFATNQPLQHTTYSLCDI